MSGNMKWAERPFTVLKVRMVSVCLETDIN